MGFQDEPRISQIQLPTVAMMGQRTDIPSTIETKDSVMPRVVLDHPNTRAMRGFYDTRSQSCVPTSILGSECRVRSTLVLQKPIQVVRKFSFPGRSCMRLPCHTHSRGFDKLHASVAVKHLGSLMKGCVVTLKGSIFSDSTWFSKCSSP